MLRLDAKEALSGQTAVDPVALNRRGRQRHRFLHSVLLAFLRYLALLDTCLDS